MMFKRVLYICLFCALFVGQLSYAERHNYSFSAGGAFNLDNRDDYGVALSAGVTMKMEGFLAAQGRLLGILTEDGYAVVPTLLGMVSLPFGPFEFNLNGGIHIFGVAHQQEETIFTIFGLAGGASLMIVPTESFAFGVRADISWLPKETSSPIDDPKVDAKETFLYGSACFVIEFRNIVD